MVDHPGLGIEALVDGRRVRVGSTGWLFPEPSEDLSARVSALAASGPTVFGVEIDGRAAGLLAVADTEKPGAKDAVGALRAMGLSPIMLTGDAAAAANAIAGRVGIAEVVAGVLPEGKLQEVRRRQAEGGRVAMVGDGINDAPALAAADVGIAVGTGTDVAIEAAHVTLVKGDLAGVARALSLARATLRVVRQNLFWAFLYNLLLVPVAAGALHGVTFLPEALRDLHPAAAAGAMAFSSISVVLNSLRLTRVRL
jgi:Cu+-exporting ATPase